MSAGRVAALVVNWSTPDDLRKCIASGLAYEADVKWTVFQNYHPTIKTDLHAIKQISPDNISWIRSDRNLGHGAGINKAARSAVVDHDPDYFFIVNPDVTWTEPVLGRMRAFLEEDPKRVVVGPKQMDSRRRITAGGIVGDNVHPKHRQWHVRDPENKLVRDAVPGPTVSGAAMLVRVPDFFEYGGLLEARHYYSETWFCYHATAHGRECWYYGEPWMIHEWHQSSPIGAPGTDGQMKHDREMFRRMCDEHNPPIARD